MRRCLVPMFSQCYAARFNLIVDQTLTFWMLSEYVDAGWLNIATGKISICEDKDADFFLQD